MSRRCQLFFDAIPGGETSWSRCNRPGAAAAESPPFIVGRGPVPRHRFRYGKTSLVFFRSFRTLMSIARAPAKNAKVL